jgi:hypothetical protein
VSVNERLSGAYAQGIYPCRQEYPCFISVEYSTTMLQQHRGAWNLSLGCVGSVLCSQYNTLPLPFVQPFSPIYSESLPGIQRTNSVCVWLLLLAICCVSRLTIEATELRYKSVVLRKPPATHKNYYMNFPIADTHVVFLHNANVFFIRQGRDKRQTMLY